MLPKILAVGSYTRFRRPPAAVMTAPAPNSVKIPAIQRSAETLREPVAASTRALGSSDVKVAIETQLVAAMTVVCDHVADPSIV